MLLSALAPFPHFLELVVQPSDIVLGRGIAEVTERHAFPFGAWPIVRHSYLVSCSILRIFFVLFIETELCIRRGLHKPEPVIFIYFLFFFLKKQN